MQNKKIVSIYACSLSATMLTSKIIPEIIEKHSEVAWCTNSCNKCFSLILANHAITYDTFIRRHLWPRCLLYERAGGNAPVMHPLSGVSDLHSLIMYKKLPTLSLSALACGPLYVWDPFS